MNAVLVVLISILSVVAAIAFIGAVLWAVRHASRDRGAEVRAAHPDAELGPELGQYRGGTGDFPRARNTSWVVLTPTTLVVRPILGNAVELPISEITGTRIQQHFNTHWNGRPVLVVETGRGEVGLTVGSTARWRTALAR
ncbi:hypothetical protein SFC88_20995 [Nocardioides sp. HM23]|uniref:hypothetical protein n=1 Tax=Nocardioides bizhenqiangii TaxID=3095076 RepID=UPI002ACA627C|nr:hypothetical protein [Nocardioides sp. HM23]MDZ5623324.1 hypothetical protein [Nocardioides sp. HM23]